MNLTHEHVPSVHSLDHINLGVVVFLIRNAAYFTLSLTSLTDESCLISTTKPPRTSPATLIVGWLTGSHPLSLIAAMPESLVIYVCM